VNATLSFLLPAVLFALVYFPTFMYLSVGLISPHAKVDVRRRFAAAYIDVIPVIAAWLMYRTSGSVLFLAGAAIYLLLRDAIGGQSLGKLLVGLVAIDLQTGRPCTWKESAFRNVFFVVPGANIVAVFLESISIVRDPQGQRLGDRLAQTMVVEGYGAKDLATEFQRWWEGTFGNIERGVRKSRRQPAER
jgi:hypothetical protein